MSVDYELINLLNYGWATLIDVSSIIIRTSGSHLKNGIFISEKTTFFITGKT